MKNSKCRTQSLECGIEFGSRLRSPHRLQVRKRSAGRFGPVYPNAEFKARREARNVEPRNWKGGKLPAISRYGPAKVRMTAGKCG